MYCVSRRAAARAAQSFASAFQDDALRAALRQAPPCAGFLRMRPRAALRRGRRAVEQAVVAAKFSRRRRT